MTNVIKTIDIPEIIETQHKKFSYYVLESRALPNIIDGLKPVQRRILHYALKIAKNEKVKVVKLAGITLEAHPHGSTSVEESCSNMAQKFCGRNNINYLDGYGAFGSVIAPDSIGASRYVSVKLNDNFHNIMGVDSQLIEMIPTYDNNSIEPKNFLPLVPTVLLNPVQGIAVGFACDILPRKLSDIIHCQLSHLDNKNFYEPKPFYDGFKGTITKTSDNVYETKGVFERHGKKLIITELPLGYDREKYVQLLDKLEDNEIISSYTDDCTDQFHFTISMKVDLSDDEIYEKFKLKTNLNENINVIYFNGKVKTMTVSQIIKEFTDYRLKLFLKRYKKIFIENKEEFEFKKDLYKVMKTGLFKKFPDLKKDEIKELLLKNDIQEKNITRIIQTPIYKFGKDEIDTLRKELENLKKYLENVVKLIKDENLRKLEYIKELKSLK